MNGNNITEKQDSLKETKNMLLKWKNDKNIQILNDFYFNTKSFGEILKVDRKEEPHSSMISWLLDINEQHNLGDFAIRKLLDILITEGENKFTEKSEDLYETLLIGDYSFQNFFIETEYFIGKSGYIDIFISMSIKMNNTGESIPINLIIENKVHSTENKDKLDESKNQTMKYYNHFEKSSVEDEKYKKDLNFYIYLTPLSSIELNELNEPQCECKDFIQINYQILSDNIFELVEQEDVSQRTKFIVQEYLKSLGKPINDKGKIMAIQKKEARLLDKFLSEHLDLIITAVNAKQLDTELEPEDREKLKQVTDILSGTKRDYTKYSFNGKTNLTKGKLILEVIKQYVSDNRGKSYEELEEIFKELRNTRVIAKLDDALALNLKDNKKRYFTNEDDLINLADGTKIAVNGGWSAGGKFDNIFKFAKKHDYKIS